MQSEQKRIEEENLFLEKLKETKKNGFGEVVLIREQPLLDANGIPFADDEFLPSFGSELVFTGGTYLC